MFKACEKQALDRYAWRREMASRAWLGMARRPCNAPFALVTALAVSARALAFPWAGPWGRAGWFGRGAPRAAEMVGGVRLGASRPDFCRRTIPELMRLKI